jgi:hypothetical protein
MHCQSFQDGLITRWPVWWVKEEQSLEWGNGFANGNRNQNRKRKPLSVTGESPTWRAKNLITLNYNWGIIPDHPLQVALRLWNVHYIQRINNQYNQQTKFFT